MLLLVVVLLKSSARYTSDRATSSSVRGASEIVLAAVNAMVIEISIMVTNLVTKKQRSLDSRSRSGGLRSYPN